MFGSDLDNISSTQWEASGGFEKTQTTLDLATTLRAYSAIENGNDSETKLLIHSDTTSGSTTFSDSSDSIHTITLNGDVVHSGNTSKFGDTSMYFDGSGDYLSVPDSTDWDFD